MVCLGRKGPRLRRKGLRVVGYGVGPSVSLELDLLGEFGISLGLHSRLVLSSLESTKFC